MECLILEGFSLEERIALLLFEIEELTSRVERLERCQDLNDHDKGEDCWGLDTMTD